MSEWKVIPSFPLYEASDDGQIRRRVRRGSAGSPGQPKATSSTWNGYLAVNIDGGLRIVSRLICEAFHGPAPDGDHQAAHLNGIRTDNRADNLRWKSRSENYKDQILHGTSKRGTGHSLALLCDDDVRSIRRLVAEGYRQKDLASRYGVAISTISMVASRKLWGHVP